MTVIKIILLVLLSVILLVFLLLCLPVGVKFTYDDSVKIRLKVGLISIPLDKIMNKGKNPEKGKKKNESNKKPSEGEKKKENETLKSIKKLYKEKGLDGFVKLISEVAKLAAGALKGLFSKMKLKKFRLNITVATGDAADTAVKYGYVCAAVYPAASLILNAVNYKDYTLNVNANFDKKKPEIDFEAEISIIAWFAVIEALKALIGIVRLRGSE